MTFLLAYLSLLCGGVISLLPVFKSKKFLFSAAFFLSGYALAGTLFLHEKAADLMQASVNEASRGIFGFIAKSFVQQLSISPGVALISLPMLSAALWLLTWRHKH